jgi:DNA-binding XRE family transcriptional regulator
VREVREQQLMTQAELARKARVALRTIHSVEKGMKCRLDTKRKILAALGIPFTDRERVFPTGELVRVRRAPARALTRSRSAG